MYKIKNMIAGIISFTIANLIVSFFGSYLFTSEDKNALRISNKRWITFSTLFIGYSILLVILILNQK